MITVLADASLPHLERLFPPPFKLTTYLSEATLKAALNTHEILCCRSTLKVDASLLEHTPIRYVATASSGTDHIDTTYLAKKNITLFDAKGSNATAVADYVLLILNTLHITHGTVGLVGYGAVGAQVADRLKRLGFSILIYDPLKQIGVPHLNDLTTVDILCLHAHLHETPPYPSRHLINTAFLNQLNPNAIIINAARGELIDEQALLSAPNQFTYCTDVYAHEPNVNPDLINYATLCTPHIAGHTIEAKIKAVIQISQSLHQAFHLPFHQPQDLFPPLPLVPYYYDPRIDTIQLKQAIDKQTAFLKQRKAHQYRHDSIE